MNICNSTTINSATSIQGWVSQPNFRGTFDIALSCAVTIFLCNWSSICVNVPPSHHGRLDIFMDKWHMFCLSLLGPEFIFCMALGQYMSARASRDSFHNSGYKDWTLTHGFFADMGGFIFQPRAWNQFPIDARQLHYLVTRGYVTYPEVSKAFIDDKNKTDGLARFVAGCQMLWFTLNGIARPIQKLAVTTLEVTTLAFILFALATSVCWRHKPRDIETAIILESDYTIEQILLEAGPAASEPYRVTPLDFISREEWIVSTLWTYNVNILGKLNMIWKRPRVRPIQMITSFTFPKMSPQVTLVPFAMTMAYSGIFVAAWNFYFPTRIERLLWRSCTSATMGASLTGGLFEVLFLFYDGRDKRTVMEEKGFNQRIVRILGDRCLPRIKWVMKRLQNNSPCKDPALNVPLRSLLITMPIMAMYVVCRGYILVEDIIGLRELPTSAFHNVDWTRYLPHI